MSLVHFPYAHRLRHWIFEDHPVLIQESKNSTDKDFSTLLGLLSLSYGSRIGVPEARCWFKRVLSMCCLWVNVCKAVVSSWDDAWRTFPATQGWSVEWFVTGSVRLNFPSWHLFGFKHLHTPPLFFSPPFFFLWGEWGRESKESL